jgi:hypothetical protein
MLERRKRSLDERDEEHAPGIALALREMDQRSNSP